MICPESKGGPMGCLQRRQRRPPYAAAGTCTPAAQLPHRLVPGLRRKARMGMSPVDRMSKWPASGHGRAGRRLWVRWCPPGLAGALSVACSHGGTAGGEVQLQASLQVLQQLAGTAGEKARQQVQGELNKCAPTGGLQLGPEVVEDAVQVVKLAAEAVPPQPDEVVVWGEGGGGGKGRGGIQRGMRACTCGSGRCRHGLGSRTGA